MIGRTFVEHEGKKHRVDRLFVTPYYDFQLYFDAHNTWADILPAMAAVEGLAEWKLLFDFATPGETGDLLAIRGADLQFIVLGLSGGKFRLSDSLGSDTLTMDALVASNDGQYHEFELDVNSTGHYMYVDGEYLNRSYSTGNSGVSLPLPADIVHATLGQGILTGFYNGLIKNLRFTNQAGDILIHFKMNDNGDAIQDLISGQFGSVHNAFWEDGFNEDPQFREVKNLYICREAGRWENVHKG